MAAVRVPGLFFIGGAADVTGPLGGYNFQWPRSRWTGTAPTLARLFLRRGLA